MNDFSKIDVQIATKEFVDELLEEALDAATDFGTSLAQFSDGVPSDIHLHNDRLNNASDKLYNVVHRLVELANKR